MAQSKMIERGLIRESRGQIASTYQNPKVVIGHPFLGRGGSESKVMWLIEALKKDYEITIVTTGGWDLKELNAYYGTAVNEKDVCVRIAPVPFRWLGRSAAIRGACYQRFAQQIASEYDLRISAYNLTDWGRPAIHFIADFSWNQDVMIATNPPSPGFFYENSLLRKAYLGIVSALAKPSNRDMLREDAIIANSRWSATVIRRTCGIECAATVYPCVWTEFRPIEWMDKEQAFVMIGRIAPEKEIERAIAILEIVRRQGHPIVLHLCGDIGNDQYGRQITKLCRQHADWIIPEGSVSGEEKKEILSHCRFGIQTRGAEPFGISVAEMVKAGAIVFAPNDGGQVEILDHNDLLFQSVDDAAEKIIAVLSSPQKQSFLRNHLARQSDGFHAANYIRDVVGAVALTHEAACG
jgi:glycosyltransferase involved in cell wall biosynthesis